MIATDQTVARAYAKILHLITGQKPVTVLSDDLRANVVAKIAGRARPADLVITDAMMPTMGGRE